MPSLTILRRVTLRYRGYHVPYPDGTWYHGLPEKEAKREFEKYYAPLRPVVLDVVRENEGSYFGVVVGTRDKVTLLMNQKGANQLPKSNWAE